MHELRAHQGKAPSSFVTLTYDPKNLPPLGSLDLPEYQNFLKRLRKITGPGLRFFGCGEYGEKFGRPHYHIIFFNYRPADAKLAKRGQDYNLYSSKNLDEIWGLGSTVTGDVSFDSCAYVARYCLKKITGKPAADHYQGRTPEFLTMSRRPGLGQTYFLTNADEIYSHDSVIINGRPVRPPRYYDNAFNNIDANIIHPLALSRLAMLKKKRRKLALLTPKSEKTNRRRVTSELVMLAKLKLKGKTL